MRCAVIGGGAWGTALADHLSRLAHDVMIWAREEDVVDEIAAVRRNTRFLPGIQLDGRLRASGDLSLVASHGADVILLVTPSQVLRGIVRELRGSAPAATTFVVASKGIEKGSLVLMSEVVEQEIGDARTVALSGPSFAAEVAVLRPTAVVAASASAESAAFVQRVFSSNRFRVYTQNDITGVELAGSLKNVMAIATGISDGLDLGFNARAALITRGLAEITRLGLAMGARAETFAGLAGIGDLVLTCTGVLSRNRSLGTELGQGRSLTEALLGKLTVAEGVATTESAYELARHRRVEMPIVSAVYQTLFNSRSPSLAMSELMERELRSESD